MQCPYCNSGMTDAGPMVRLRQRLSRKRFDIFETILSAGQDGISGAKLAKKFYRGGSPGSLRSCVCNINNVIDPMHIKCKNGTYYLIRNGSQSPQ